VIGDGEQQAAAGLWRICGSGGGAGCATSAGRKRANGNAQRDYGMEQARGDYFLFLDDDDVFTPGAIGLIRPELNGYPTVFKMRHPESV
jgi:hypothetical protein